MLPSMLVQAALILSALPAHARSDGRTMHTLVASSVINLDDALDRNGTSSEAFGYSIQGYAAPTGNIQVGGTVYRWGKQLGKGAFGTVYELKSSEKTFVGKFVPLAEMDGTNRVREEIRLQKLCEGKHIVEIIGDINLGNRAAVIVMEYLDAGDLAKRITDLNRQIQKNGLPGVEDIFKQIVEGVIHMHNKGVVHQDLKPENIFLAHAEGQVIAKIGDFGSATEFGDVTRSFTWRRFTPIGAYTNWKPFYMAPEMIMSSKKYSTTWRKWSQDSKVEKSTGRNFDSSYGPEVDVWALGVMLYEMLTGRTPWCFGHEDTSRCFTEILLHAPPSEPYPECVTQDAKDLIEAMLQKNVKERITIDKILDNSAMKKLVKSSTDTSTSLLQEFKDFAMKGAGLVLPSLVTSRRNLRGTKP